MLNMSNVKLLDIAENIFYDYTKYTPVDYILEFTDNVYERKLELAIDEDDEKEIIANKDFYLRVNGTIALPIAISERPYVVISNNAPKENYQIINTIIHELTHIHDFYDIVKYNDRTHFTRMRNLDNITVFTLWSEFHAKKIGYFTYRSTLNKSFGYADNDILENIINIELPHWNRHLLLSLEDSKANPFSYMSCLFSYFGRYAVWSELYSDRFPGLPNGLSLNHRVIINELFNFLRINSEYNLIRNKLEKLGILMNNLYEEVGRTKVVL